MSYTLSSGYNHYIVFNYEITKLSFSRSCFTLQRIVWHCYKTKTLILISFEPSPAAYGFVTACLVRSFFAPDPIDNNAICIIYATITVTEPTKFCFPSFLIFA